MEDEPKTALPASPENPRLIGRVVSMRPIAPGIIVTPGNKPDSLSSARVWFPALSWVALVTFTPRPPREENSDAVRRSMCP